MLQSNGGCPPPAPAPPHPHFEGDQPMKFNSYGGGGSGQTRLVHHNRLHTDDILNINVGGKKFTIRRMDLLADPRSKLADWFRPGTTRLVPVDRGGNYYLDRDPKTFRHVIAYLRFKKERCVPSLALPSSPDELAKLVGESEALNLVELRETALEMLQKYLRTEEQHYVTSYVQMATRDYDAWLFEREGQDSSPSPGEQRKGAKETGQQQAQMHSAYDDWDSL